MTHTVAPAFAHTSGAAKPRIVLVGEAWGGNEASLGKPFVGEAGKELFRILLEAFPDIEPELGARICELHRYGSAWVKDREPWFEAAGIALTNVLSFQPPDNKIEALCASKKELPASYLLPAITKAKYLREEYLGELARLEQELSAWNPNLIVALGNTACWALLRATNIGSIRGAITQGIANGPAAGKKVLPTYHPAGVLRQWAWRPIVVADLMKAKRESAFSEIRRPERRVMINPTLSEVKIILESWSYYDALEPRHCLFAADTETEAGQITCISFASSSDVAIVIPFWDKTKPGWSYWEEDEERQVWESIERFMEYEYNDFLWQNGMYDYQYVTPMAISIAQSVEDTMLLHHSIYPELQKGLGFLGSLYTNEASWKLMRNWKQDSEKRDE